MTTLGVHEVPSADTAPATWSGPRGVLRGIVTDPLARRSVLRYVVGGAMGLGLSLIGALPPAKPKGAWAHCCLNEWTNGCHGYYTSSQICYPANSKFSNNCTSGWWHRNDGASGTCYSLKYSHNHTSCDGRNAWRWAVSTGSYRCSDGWYSYADCGGGRVETFSICRHKF